MSPSPEIHGIHEKLDKLLTGVVRLEVKFEHVETRVAKVEAAQSAEKERLDRMFDTQVRPIRERHNGNSYLLKAVITAGAVAGAFAACLALYRNLVPAAGQAPVTPASMSPLLPGVKDAQLPEVRIRRKPPTP